MFSKNLELKQMNGPSFTSYLAWFHATCASKGCPPPYLQTFIKHKCEVHIFCFIYMLRLVIEYIHTAYMYLDLYMPIHICLLRLHMCTLCTLCMNVWRSWNLWLYLQIYHLFGTCRCISAYRDSGDSGSDRNFYPGRTEVQRKWENGAGTSWKF